MERPRPAILPLIIFALITSCVSASALADISGTGQKPTYDLTANWLDNGDTLKVEHVERLIAMAKADPQAYAIVTDAESVLGVSTAAELMNYMTLFKADLPDPNDKLAMLRPRSRIVIEGTATVLADHQAETKSLVELIGRSAPDHRASLEGKLKANEKEIAFDDKPDYVTIDAVQRQGVCLAQNVDLLTGFGDFIHELTHLSHLMPKADYETFLTKYSSADDYVKTKLMEDGGEFEANLNGYRAMVRAAHSRNALNPGLRECFDDSGNLVNKDKFVAYLLKDAGYDQNIREGYANEMVSNFNLLSQMDGMLVGMYNDRNQGFHPYFSSSIHQISRDSQQRLVREINDLRYLRERYLSRFQTDNIPVQLK